MPPSESASRGRTFSKSNERSRSHHRSNKTSFRSGLYNSYATGIPKKSLMGEGLPAFQTTQEHKPRFMQPIKI